MNPGWRPLPQLSEINEFFWTGGAVGELRFRRCNSCGALQHPPGPVCAHCGSDELVIAVVSGRGIVIATTTNHHQWYPGCPPPYVVAQVSIEEDPRVRLTTNIVECDPDTVFVGMPVAVCFQEVEDVWLPVFAPRDGAAPVALPPDELSAHDIADRVRPMVSPRRFEDRVAITGIGASRIGRRLMVDPVRLAVDACRAAVEDAGLRPEDIDGLSTYPGPTPNEGFSEGGIAAVEAALRIRPTWYNGAFETFGPGGSVITAMLAIASGLCRHVLCFRTVWQTTYAEELRSGRRCPDLRRVEGFGQWLLPFGAGPAIHTIAQCASAHFHRYGTTRESLGWIALNARANASRHPDAIYREPLTMERYLQARLITTPFGLYDCDVP